MLFTGKLKHLDKTSRKGMNNYRSTFKNSRFYPCKRQDLAHIVGMAP